MPNQDCDTTANVCKCTPGNEPQANDDGVNVCVTSLGKSKCHPEMALK